MWPFKKKKLPNKSHQRQFQAAVISRLTASWTTNSQAIDWDIKNSLKILRSRSRDASVNNPYAHKFLQMCSTHVVGPTGFSFRVRVSETDAKGNIKIDGLASKAIESAFWKWAKRGNCDITGRHSFFDICNLYIKAVARDGEVLIRKVYGAGPFGFQLQILDVDRLDVDKNEELRDGRRIKMGVELDPYGKPVAYWLRTKHPGADVYYTETGSMFERVLADDIYHHYVSERPEQTRGIPWMHSAMVRLNNLLGYEEAAVIAARVGAAKMGFFTSPDGDGTALADEVTDDGQLITEADAGQFGVLPQGYDFKSFDPDYPHAMFGDFVKACLRGVSSGLGVAYNTLSNDLEGVNFSSIRTGVLEERDNWMVVQNWMIESFLDDLFSTWLKWALLSKAVVLPNGSALPITKFDKFNQGIWQGRRWQWVDPAKDIDANVIAIKNRLKSRTAVIEEQGKDAEDVFAQLAEEEERLKTLGLGVEEPKTLPAAPKDAPEEEKDE